MAGAGDAGDECLPHRIDRYNGVLVSSSLPADATEFQTQLSASIAAWRAAGRKGVWLKLGTKLAHLIPLALERGFLYHHAKEAYVMLTLWLPDTPNTLPGFASTYVGVGGAVIREGAKGKEILVVQEKNGPVTGIWKLPGGMADAGEDVGETAVREVYEETGVECTFQSVVCFRQAHNAAFHMSDMYFVCRLKPLSPKQRLRPQASEIAAAKWMAVEELLALPYYRGLYHVIMQLAAANADDQYPGIAAESLPIGFRPGHNTLYHSCAARL